MPIIHTECNIIVSCNGVFEMTVKDGINNILLKIKINYKQFKVDQTSLTCVDSNFNFELCIIFICLTFFKFP